MVSVPSILFEKKKKKSYLQAIRLTGVEMATLLVLYIHNSTTLHRGFSHPFQSLPPDFSIFIGTFPEHTVTPTNQESLVGNVPLLPSETESAAARASRFGGCQGFVRNLTSEQSFPVAAQGSVKRCAKAEAVCQFPAAQTRSVCGIKQSFVSPTHTTHTH